MNTDQTTPLLKAYPCVSARPTRRLAAVVPLHAAPTGKTRLDYLDLHVFVDAYAFNRALQNGHCVSAQNNTRAALRSDRHKANFRIAQHAGDDKSVMDEYGLQCFVDLIEALYGSRGLNSHSTFELYVCPSAAQRVKHTNPPISLDADSVRFVLRKPAQLMVWLCYPNVWSLGTRRNCADDSVRCRRRRCRAFFSVCNILNQYLLF